MKTFTLQVFIVLIILSFFLPPPSYAPLVTSPSTERLEKPSSVPDEVMGQKRMELNRQRQALNDQRINLEREIDRHDNRCSRVPAGNSSLNEECRSMMKLLLVEAAAYRNQLDAFDKDVRAAVDKAKSSPQGPIVPLFSKGSKDSAPVDLRFMGIDEPLVVHPEDVKGTSKATVKKDRNDLRDAVSPQKGGATLDDLTAKGLDSFARGDYVDSIRYYREALKLSPNARGIQLALGHVLYLREKGQKGSPKAEILLDALQFGKGDWEASIGFLKDALEKKKDKDIAQAVRDALNYTEGLYAYQQFQEARVEAQLQKELNDIFLEDTLAPVTMQTLREGFICIESGDYLGAVYSFEGALRMNPKDRRIREMLNYAEGLLEADMVRLLFVDDLPK